MWHKRRAGPRVPPKGNPHRNASNVAQPVGRGLASRRKATNRCVRNKGTPPGSVAKPMGRLWLCLVYGIVISFATRNVKLEKGLSHLGVTEKSGVSIIKR